MSIKNPLTPAGIEPTTFRFVAQHIYHCATVVRSLYMLWVSIGSFESSNDPDMAEAYHRGSPGSIQFHLTVDLWWTNWH